VIELEIAEAAAYFPAVREQLLVDGCARTFEVNDSGIESADIRSLQLLLSGGSISNVRSHGFQIGFLGNVNLERLFLNCSKSDIRKNESELLKENRIDFALTDVSVLSIEALDSLLLNESISIGSEDALLKFILKLDRSYRGLLRHIQIEFLSEDGLSLLCEDFGIPPESVWQCTVELIAHPPPPPFDSRIISDLPEIFAEFRKKRFSLLWRGSRDGFKTQEFHCRCDGHANTLTVILDKEGNIFGGFTPLEWESRVHNGQFGKDDNCLKADDSQKSFVFTLKNPHNVPARRFALKPDRKQEAIVCDSKWGPCFGSKGDISVYDSCGENAESNTSFFGYGYINDTGLSGDTFFTGSQRFQVNEIEVFEIAD
jgi:hypothetical protein